MLACTAHGDCLVLEGFQVLGSLAGWERGLNKLDAMWDMLDWRDMLCKWREMDQRSSASGEEDTRKTCGISVDRVV